MSFYNYIISTADLALSEYIQTGDIRHLREAIRRLSIELDHRERALSFRRDAPATAEASKEGNR